jgi:sugar lactone lactonase YvrE
MALCTLGFLSACNHASVVETPVEGVATVSGRLMGGQQPVTGATIQLYQAGTAGDGSPSAPMLTSTVTTDATGSFGITMKYTCPSASTEVYITATGGNPGLAAGTNNKALSMMAALGSCGALSSSTFITIDEVTTVGSVAALYPYMTSYAAVGSGTSDAQQLAAAFATVNEYVNIGTGFTPGPTLPAGYYASATEINTLADIVSLCINSNGGVANDGTACGTLFQLTKPPTSAAATDVVGAVLNILYYPNQNVAALFAQTPSIGAPVQPTLTAAPSNWTLPIIPIPATPTFTPMAGSYSGPQSVSVNDTTIGTAVYYTTNGATPTLNSTAYTGPITVSTSETVKAIAVQGGRAYSPVASAVYTIAPPAPAAAPTFSVAGGTYSANQSVTISSTTSGAFIYYTTDGSTPTTSSMFYSGPVTVYETETLQAIAISGTTSVSAVSTAAYVLTNIYGTISTVAGNGLSGYSGDGVQATSTSLYYPYSTALDSNGNLYIADFANNRVRMVTPAGVISTVAGTGYAGYSGDGGQATSAFLQGPSAVAIDSANNLYIDDDFNFRIRKVTPAGIITTVAGSGVSGFQGDGGQATLGSFSYSCGVALDVPGNLYIVDCGGNRVRKVSVGGILSTIAGTGAATSTGDGGAATAASVDVPQGVAIDQSGNVYVAESGSNRIRKIATNGTISTFAGTGVAGFSGDGGQAASAQLYQPEGLTVDASGKLYISDSANSRVRVVTQAGVISTIAGNGVAGFSGDGGPAGSASLYGVSGVTLDSGGDLYIADLNNNRVRKVTFSASAAQTGAPLFSLASGTYNGTQYLTLSSTTAGAAIYYTSNGSTPTTSSTLYTGFLTLASSGTVKAIAVQSGYLPSAVVSATYTITNLSASGTPSFAPAAGSYTGTQTVTITSGTANASIYYTTDNSVPTTSSTLYTAPITISSSKTINAIAVASGLANSAIGTAGYYINQGTGIIVTYAGNGTSGFLGDGGQATSAELYASRGVAVDGAGNLYFSDTNNQRVRKVTPAGVISTYAGSGGYGFSGDGGLAVNAVLYYPEGLAVDPSGNLYIADEDNSRIRKVTPGGTISTVAGIGGYGFSGDGGLATSATLAYPQAVAVDSAGNLYIADSNNARVRKVSPSGIIMTIAGTGVSGFSGDGGAATSARFGSPVGIAVDSAGNVYISDSNNSRIRKVTPGGIITTFAGSGSIGFSGDGGAATSAALYYPAGIWIDSAGSLYIADQDNDRIRKVAPSGIISTIAGNGNGAFSGDGGSATNAALYNPAAGAVDGVGNVYIADSGNARIRKILYSNALQASAPVFSVPAGSYAAVQYLSIYTSTPGASIYFTSDGSTPTASSTLYSTPLTLGASGTINAISVAPGYSSSTVTSAVYSITVLPQAAVPTFSPAAGTYATTQTVSLASSILGASIYYTTDGSTPTASSTLYSAAISISTSKTINAITVASGYNTSAVASAGFYINPGPGIISTVAGSGGYGTFAGDGSAATSASLYSPRGTAVDGAGNLYIADSSNNRIRKVNAAGIISTVAGSGTYYFGGFSGDNGPATSALLYAPSSVAVDAGGNLYIADAGNNRIRKVSTTGVITTVAGNGTAGFLGDGGSALTAEMSDPIGVAVDAVGNLYIADTGNNRIRKVTLAGIITTIGGNGTSGYNGDGIAATSATLYQPYAVALDPLGNVYVADYYNARIRKIIPGGIISTVAGGGGYGFAGDGGQASGTAVKMTYPTGVAADSAGNIYFSDSSNYRVRAVSASGILSTAAGNGTNGFTGDAGLATAAELSGSTTVSVDSSGSVYVSDPANERIRKITH